MAVANREAQIKTELQGVRIIMLKNVLLVIERNESLISLEEKSAHLWFNDIFVATQNNICIKTQTTALQNV